MHDWALPTFYIRASHGISFLFAHIKGQTCMTGIHLQCAARTWRLCTVTVRYTVSRYVPVLYTYCSL